MTDIETLRAEIEALRQQNKMLRRELEAVRNQNRNNLPAETLESGWNEYWRQQDAKHRTEPTV